MLGYHRSRTNQKRRGHCAFGNWGQVRVSWSSRYRKRGTPMVVEEKIWLLLVNLHLFSSLDRISIYHVHCIVYIYRRDEPRNGNKHPSCWTRICTVTFIEMKETARWIGLSLWHNKVTKTMTFNPVLDPQFPNGTQGWSHPQWNEWPSK